MRYPGLHSQTFCGSSLLQVSAFCDNHNDNSNNDKVPGPSIFWSKFYF